eukprot:5104583-Pyramimonas_sp.AAC.1
MPAYNRYWRQYRRDLLYLVIILVQVVIYIWSQKRNNTDESHVRAKLLKLKHKLEHKREYAFKLLDMRESTGGAYPSAIGAPPSEADPFSRNDIHAIVAPPSEEDPFPRNVIHADLSARMIGNYEFHYAKDVLLGKMLAAVPKNIASTRDLVVIVGFEKGEEAVYFTRQGFRVLAFEASEKWINMWPSKIEMYTQQMQEKLREKVQLVHAL